MADGAGCDLARGGSTEPLAKALQRVVLHGRDAMLEGDPLFAGLPSPFTATRYHSLAVEPATLPAELAVTARTASGVVMALAHRTLPLRGVQFHPEAVLTDGGYRLLGNWLQQTGCPAYADASARGASLSPHRAVA